jgi:hypothetical protein
MPHDMRTAVRDRSGGLQRRTQHRFQYIMERPNHIPALKGRKMNGFGITVENIEVSECRGR